MQTNTTIQSDKRKGNLFINLSGTLDRKSAGEIKNSKGKCCGKCKNCQC